MGNGVDPIAGIEDTIVRRIVRVAVHVRRFLPYYVTGAAFVLTMAAVPRLDTRGNPAATAAPRGAVATAAGRHDGAVELGRAGPAQSVAVGAGMTADPRGMVWFGDHTAELTDHPGDSTSTTGPVSAPTRGAAASGRGEDPFGGPGSGTPTDLPEAPTTPEPCTVKPPSPAPEVDATREVSGGQDTAEAAIGQELPADAGATTAPISQEAICNAPEAPVEVPAVPMPATPLARNEGPGSGLGRILRSLLRC